METLFASNPLVQEQESETAVDFAYTLIMGVDAKIAELDKIIEKNSQHWKIERIANVELSILRLSLYEMLYTDIPVRAAINEAIELSKTFGDEKSRGFVNGILDGVAKSRKNNQKNNLRLSVFGPGTPFPGLMRGSLSQG